MRQFKALVIWRLLMIHIIRWLCAAWDNFDLVQSSGLPSALYHHEFKWILNFKWIGAQGRQFERISSVYIKRNTTKWINGRYYQTHRSMEHEWWTSCGSARSVVRFWPGSFTGTLLENFRTKIPKMNTFSFFQLSFVGKMNWVKTTVRNSYLLNKSLFIISSYD